MNKYITLSISFFGLACPVLAQDQCVSVVDDKERLDCYDRAFKPKEPESTNSLIGKWTVHEDSSKLDDSKSVTLSVDSDEPVRGRFGGSEAGTLIVRCKENTTSLYIIWAGNFMSDLQGRGRVDYRIDTQPARHAGMDASTDNMALGLWNGGASIPLINKLMDANKFYVRATPFNESPVEMTFTVTGLKDAAVPLKTACGW